MSKVTLGIALVWCSIGSGAQAEEANGLTVPLFDALARGYEIKSVIWQSPIDPKDPRDRGADVLYLQKGSDLLVCFGPKRGITVDNPVREKARAMCMKPDYLR